MKILQELSNNASKQEHQKQLDVIKHALDNNFFSTLRKQRHKVVEDSECDPAVKEVLDDCSFLK